MQLPKTGKVGVTTLIGHKHVPMFICSTHSFFYNLKKFLPFTVIDDGTLTASDVLSIHWHFPNIKIIRHKQANIKINKILSRYHHLREYRHLRLNDRFNIKLTDPFLLTSYQKIIYFDCDILFFNIPWKILSWIANGNESLYASETTKPKTTSEPDEWRIINNMFKEFIGLSIDPNFNSGFLCIKRIQYDLKLLDRATKYLTKIGLCETWVPEQYSLSALFAKNKAMALGNNYKHVVNPQDQALRNPYKYTFIHYAYLAKTQYISHAIKLLLRTHFFRKSALNNKRR